MARLIDADKLIYQSHAQHIQPYINKKDIDNAPTVEMAEDCISRQALIEKATSWDKHFADSERCVSLTDIQNAPSVTPQPKSEDMGEVSDGYHTFNQLYHQRAILFATIVNQNKDRAWKSYKHEDGKYCFDKDGEWFIVGIDTPLGSYTYHYSKEYWDYFDCEELECGKLWDGHTEEDVIRLLSLPSVTPQPKRGKWISVDDGGMCVDGYCSECNNFIPKNVRKILRDYCDGDFCPNCGAKMEVANETI